MRSLLTLSGRISLILLAALLVVGLTMSAVNLNSAQSQTINGIQPQPHIEGRADGDFHGPTDQSLATQLAFGLGGVLQNAVIVGLIVLVVQWIERRRFTPSAKLAS